jgi:coenzyme F420 hydrogenase subunit beta
MRYDPEVARTFPIVFSFFCAGVPSQNGSKALLAALGVESKELVQFRYRGQGWPGKAKALLMDGTERAMSYEESWGTVLSKHVQHRCKLCADGTGGAADIVCADAWESDQRGYPLFDERPGVSLIMARTELGRNLIAEAGTAGHLEVRAFDIAQLTAIQPGQRERRRALLARLLARRLAGRPVPRYRGLRLLAASRQNSIMRNLKNFLGMLRRTWGASKP